MTATKSHPHADAAGTDWVAELPSHLGELQPTCTTTPPAISEFIARSQDGDFFSVHWDCFRNLFRVERVRPEYAEQALAPTLNYRGVGDFLELFGESSADGRSNDSSGVTARLERIEAGIKQLVESPKKKESYTTAEVAAILGKADYTVREWCRDGRVWAEKRECGRGRSKDWSISAVEVERYQNEGLLPDSNKMHNQ